ncbi:hypothetical protein L1049_016734 [Liquidambar formosana]|uniref:Uncharacterized protein n=1 Tax=Liquidambar formosana TaxID=63359 RepID=A0AAP0S1X9_LIQFO
MASKVSDQVVRDEAAAAFKLERFHWITLWIPVSEVVKPTTPARSEKMMKTPVAMFPIGKYIGNMRAGTDKIDAAGMAQAIKQQ